MFILVCLTALMLTQAVMLPAHASMMSLPTEHPQAMTHEDHAGHGGHLTHGEQADDCLLQMGAACIQLCSMSAMPATRLSGTQPGPASFVTVALATPANPYLEKPSPPPRS